MRLLLLIITWRGIYEEYKKLFFSRDYFQVIQIK